MNNLIKTITTIFLLMCLSMPSAYADNLGRLFTTQNERKELDYIRNQKPVEKIEVKPVEIETIIEPVEEETIVRDAIRLKGIVYRGDGKSTAWINESNTFEGDLESQYIQISDKDIETDQVQILMPDNQTRIKLKVGDYYDPQRKDDK